MTMRPTTIRAVALTTLGFGAAQEEGHEKKTCISHSQPNPIWRDHPTNITGTVNATMAILPIPLSLARSIIPKEYAILEDAYRSFLPRFPEDMYPAMLQAIRDVDVRYGEYVMPDFSKASIEFPFIDLLNDGTPFRWAPTLFLTAENEMAIKGAKDYGTNVYPGAFEPECNAYEHSEKSPNSTYFQVSSVAEGDDAAIDILFRNGATEIVDIREFPAQFFVSATNQPSFAEGQKCSKFTRFFSGPLSNGDNAAVPVVGTVRARIASFKDEMVWTEAVGMQVDTPFIEDHLVDCKSLSGHAGPAEQQVELAWPNTAVATNSSFLPSFSLQAVLANYVVAPIKRAVS